MERSPDHETPPDAPKVQPILPAHEHPPGPHDVISNRANLIATTEGVDLVLVPWTFQISTLPRFRDRDGVLEQAIRIHIQGSPANDTMSVRGRGSDAFVASAILPVGQGGTTSHLFAPYVASAMTATDHAVTGSVASAGRFRAILRGAGRAWERHRSPRQRPSLLSR